MTGKQLKNSILQWAIQGKLVPQDPNDEPASVLLERIRAEKQRLIKEKKIKRPKNESIIYRGDDNSYYEKFSDGTVRCIDDEIPFEIPSSWEWARFSSIYQSLTDGAHNTPKYTDNGIPFISVKDMSTGKIMFDNTKFISPEEHMILSSRCNPQKGDLLLSKVGTTGIPAKITTDRAFSLFVSVALIKYNHDYIDEDFLCSLIQSPLVQEQAAENTRGVGNKNWVLTDIANTLIALPPIREQRRIVVLLKRVLPIVEKYDKEYSALRILNADIKELLRKSILQEAIQGHLVSQDPNDEPASVLLKRIKAEKARLIKEKRINKDKVESVIFKGDDNRYYEQTGKDVRCIDDEIPFEVPDSWTWVRISNIFEINPKNNVEDQMDAAFIPMEKIQAGYGSRYSYDIVKWGKIKKSFTHFADGDVAFAKITPCFQNRKSMILKELPNGVGAGTTELKVLRPFANTVNRLYLLHFLESPYFIDEASFKGTANQQRIIVGYLENKLFPLPPLQEQQRIVEKIDELFKLC